MTVINTPDGLLLVPRNLGLTYLRNLEAENTELRAKVAQLITERTQAQNDAVHHRVLNSQLGKELREAQGRLWVYKRQAEVKAGEES